jgi:hypothetical protein
MYRGQPDRRRRGGRLENDQIAKPIVEVSQVYAKSARKELLHEACIEAYGALGIETRIAECEYARTERFVERWLLDTCAEACFEPGRSGRGILSDASALKRNCDLWIGGRPNPTLPEGALDPSDSSTPLKSSGTSPVLFSIRTPAVKNKRSRHAAWF